MICPSEKNAYVDGANQKNAYVDGRSERFNNPRSQCLSQAMDLITGDRNREYGEPLDNFQRIATGWQVILGHEVTPHKVALCMAWLKIARLCETPGHADSYVDAAAYAALAFELVHAQGGEG
jgi:hypothetical protein